MTSPTPVEPEDLLDLKLLPSWLKETAPAPNYEHYQGDEGSETDRPRRPQRGGERGRERRPGERFPGKDRPPGGRREGKPPSRDKRDRGPGRGRPGARGDRPPQRRDDEQKRLAQETAARQLGERVSVRFVPHPPVLDNVIAQIKSNPVAYSVFALARLFLSKPERYDVKLGAKAEGALFQLGENGAVSADRDFLETNAFRFAQADFYKVEVVQGEPIKGNFNSVARCRASGTLLGPTNHHAYQPKLRALYEQRFSRRMSFPEYQRQIEIVTDPTVVEQWKEEARNTTTYSTIKEEPTVTFATAAEAERHFRQNYFPALVRPVTEQTVDGVTSRQMPDRFIRRLIEDAWTRETRSPSQMMQELSARLRDSGVHIFRHRRGMLFVSTVRARPFGHDEQGVSPQVRAIFELLAANPGINRKDFAGKILGDVPEADVETRKLALASDLHWLISEGYVIEFNDGSLDLPRVKAKPAAESATAPDAKAQGETAEASDKPASETAAVVESEKKSASDASSAVEASVAAETNESSTPSAEMTSASLAEESNSEPKEEEPSSPPTPRDETGGPS